MALPIPIPTATWAPKPRHATAYAMRGHALAGADDRATGGIRLITPREFLDVA